MFANIALLFDLLTDIVDQLEINLMVFLRQDGEVLAHKLDDRLFRSLCEERVEGESGDLEEIVLFFYLVELEGAFFKDQSNQCPLVMLELHLRVVLECLYCQWRALELHLTGLL